MGKQMLKPGEHGEIFLKETSTGSWRGRARLRLLDGDYTSVSRSASNRDAARLRVQEGITERLNAPKGSESLTPTSKFGLACREWVNEMRVRATWPRPPIRPQTIDEYERLLGNHAVPRLGKRCLNELTPAVCQGLLDSIVERGKDGKFDLVTTASQVRSAVNQVLDRAVIHDALRDNPMRKTKAPAPRKPDPKALTVTDVYRLRAAVRAWEEVRRGKPGPKPRGHLPAAVDLMLGTGMRIGEVMALQWGAVNLSPDGLPTVAVEATMVDIKGQGTVRQEMPKTDAGERTIIVPPFVVASLKAIRPEVTTAQTAVFASRRFKDGRNVGRPVTTHNMRRMLRAALELAGMAGEVHPHLLRSTVATFVARRMSSAEASALLGHKIGTGVTERHYIERLRLAPDTSAVLQAMIEIGEEEARSAVSGKAEREPVAGRVSVAVAVADPDESGW
ncbi:tyrosine recombinase XerC [Myceligenerans pegani]|uniref:Tyrosine-type recombinase/integrase family protein n=1 Tax=Myceligenerans pegani TaxID=2776917 RepID=A0ABR9MSW1_9MICO|nr:tyrosine-type recombinase/integrase [Myceligenerans sp. TRM 65318]MBE1874470.1 tyrosine-type recombinase/integrase family protein [Myceligenerans sp. TRM 65318]MBE3016741.1 tyrosine-type recombinase/integrase family protein [Myceligenerans sp. TRM 65318]